MYCCSASLVEDCSQASLASAEDAFAGRFAAHIPCSHLTVKHCIHESGDNGHAAHSSILRSSCAFSPVSARLQRYQGYIGKAFSQPPITSQSITLVAQTDPAFRGGATRPQPTMTTLPSTASRHKLLHPRTQFGDGRHVAIFDTMLELHARLMPAGSLNNVSSVPAYITTSCAPA